MDITIRKAKKEDMRRVHELIMELAIYEKLPQEVEINLSDLVNRGYTREIKSLLLFFFSGLSMKL